MDSISVPGPSSGGPPKAVHRPLPLKSASMNPYISRYTNIDVYTNITGATNPKSSAAPSTTVGVTPATAAAAAASKPKTPFVNPYVNTRPSAPRPQASLATSTSSTDSLGSSRGHIAIATAATGINRPASSTSVKPSGSSAIASRPIASSLHASSSKPPSGAPRAEPATASTGKASRPKSRRHASQKETLSASALPPGPDSTWIHKSLALKMKYTDFKAGEYIVREDWSGSMRFPDNLDPPNGLMHLRCLFCEKQYGGVNARSMWRRHVSQKHDVILSGAKTATIIPRPRSRKPSKALKEFTRPSSLRRLEDEYDADASFDAKMDSESDEDDYDVEGLVFEAPFENNDTQESVDPPSEVEADREEAAADASAADSDDAEVESVLIRVNEPVLVANAWDDDDDDLARITSHPFTALPSDRDGGQFLPPVRTPRPAGVLRRSVSTPANLGLTPSPSKAAAMSNAFASNEHNGAPSASPFLLPPFEDSPATTLSMQQTRSNGPNPMMTATKEIILPPPQFTTTQFPDITTRALKKHKIGLLPGITLAPSLRSPRGLGSGFSPMPKFSVSATSSLASSSDMSRWNSSREITSTGGGSSRAAKVSNSEQERSSPEPGAESPSRGVTSRMAHPSPSHLEANTLATPAPSGRKRAMTESDRMRWMMALESPGPLGRSTTFAGSSPDFARTSFLGHTSSPRHASFLASSPLNLETSTSSRGGLGRSNSAFFMPPPTFIGSSPAQPDSMSMSMDFSTSTPLRGFDLISTPGAGPSSVSGSRSLRRIRSFSLFSTPGSVFSGSGVADLSLQSSTSSRPTPAAGQGHGSGQGTTHTRNSSTSGEAMGDASFSTSATSFLDDDPFRSLHLDTSTSSISSHSFAFGAQGGDTKMEESTSMMLFGVGTPARALAASASRPKSAGGSALRTSRVVSAGMKRAREDDDHRHHRPSSGAAAKQSIMDDAADRELNVDMLDVDIDGFDWDRDMSPVKKKARPSQNPRS